MIAPIEALQRAPAAPPHRPSNLHTVSGIERYAETTETVAGINGFASDQPAEAERSRTPALNTVCASCRTVGDQGLSEAEITRIRAVLERWCRRNAYVLFWTLGDALRDMPEAEAREIIRHARNTLRTAQKRHTLQPEDMVVLEVTGGLHAHILGPATPKIMKAIRRSEKFAPFMLRPSRAIRPVTNAYGFAHLADEYLVKETGDPKFALPHGGGDRVILSPTLKAVMVAEGRIEDYQRTTSRNLKPTPPRAVKKPRQTIKAEIEVQAAPVTTTQEKPILSVVPTSPSLFPTLVEQRLVSPQELQAFREDHGISQAEIADMLHISDRSHIANFERGHDNLSRPRLRILRNFMDRYQPRKLAA